MHLLNPEMYRKNALYRPQRTLTVSSFIYYISGLDFKVAKWAGRGGERGGRDLDKIFTRTRTRANGNPI